MGTSRGESPTAADRPSWPEGTHYRYRRGGHELIVSRRGVTERLVAVVEQAPADFALVVDGPWIVLCYRFGDASSWSVAPPFNWHMVPEKERVVPAEVELSSETYSRLWSTLWIRLVDSESGAVRARRAVALRPEFTRALHEAIRSQAREPFSGAVADHSLAWLNHAVDGLVGRAVVTTRCNPSSGPGAGHPVHRPPGDREAGQYRTRRQAEPLQTFVSL
jgi:hypothetical protein